jgi:hypothetical protein
MFVESMPGSPSSRFEAGAPRTPWTALFVALSFAPAIETPGRMRAVAAAGMAAPTAATHPTIRGMRDRKELRPTTRPYRRRRTAPGLPLVGGCDERPMILHLARD